MLFAPAFKIGEDNGEEARPTGEGSSMRIWDRLGGGRFPRPSIPSAELGRKRTIQLLGGTVCQAEGTESAKALRLGSEHGDPCSLGSL